MDIKVNYAGITRRIIAYVIDHVIILGVLPSLFFVLTIIFAVTFLNNELGEDSLDMADDFFGSNTSLVTFIISAFFTILETLMLTRFSGTPGQLLCYIRIKDAKTFKNVTITQAAIRCIFTQIATYIIYFSNEHILIWLTAPLIAIAFATFDRRKQFFHDKIARTVAIDYKFLS